MQFIERVMRVMTQLNIGAALGLAGWLMWWGWQLASGQTTLLGRTAEAQSPLRLAQLAEPAPMQLVPVQTAAGLLPPCSGAAPLATTGAEL